MAQITEGAQAPEIRLKTHTGEEFLLSAHRGKPVVLFFYPKADTPGCTTEACEFRDAKSQFDAADTVVVGISPDPVAKQGKFQAKYSLTAILLADEENEAAANYGVWVEKSMYGKKYMGVERTTFLIGKDGKIVKVFRKVKPAGHAEQVLAEMSSLGMA